MTAETPRQHYLSRLSALETERSSWISHWRELSEQLSPRTSRWLVEDANKGHKKNDAIINLAPVRAAGILAAGMMTSITSPARKWFKLTIPDPSLAEARGVRSWLDLVERRLFEILARSNIYSALSAVYLDLATYGVTAMYVEEDEQDVVRAYLFPLGSYCLANSPRLSVDTIYRLFRMTVGQMVEKFGRENCPPAVRDSYDEGRRDEWRKVLHVVEPNPEADRKFLDSGSMPFRSIWIAVDSEDAARDFLRKGGYEEFPVVAPRWTVVGEDVYGSDCPGMKALGDAKALQQYELESAKATARGVTPPMVASTALRNQRASLIPGDVIYGDSTAHGPVFAPALQIDPAWVQILEEKINRIERRIDGAFFADLFLSMMESDRQITAEEVRARQQEKMLQLGPVLERLNDELLDPLIDRVFAIALRSGQIPPPPRELLGQSIRVEYLSILSQAQKTLGVASVQSILMVTGQIAQMAPQVLKKLDFFKVLDDLAEMMGVPPDELRSTEDVLQELAAEAQQQAQAQQAQALMVATQGAKNLAQSDMSGDNGLTRVLSALGPQAQAAAASDPTGSVQ